MTAKELYQYRSICAEIFEKKYELEEEKISDTVSGSSPCFPFVKHPITVRGLKNTKKTSALQEKIKKLEAEKRRIEKFIGNIPDNFTRRIFEYRFIKGKHKYTWQAIAMRIGGGNSADNLRMIVYRYLKKNNAP